MTSPDLRSGIWITLLILFALAGLVSCGGPDEKEEEASAPPREDELFRVGSIVVYESDLVHRLEDRHRGRTDEQTRKAALDALVKRAQFAQAALDAGLADDVVVREEFSRLLESRLRERELAPLLRQEQAIPEERLRKLYEAQISRFQAPETRHVAALWLDSGPDPERVQRYVDKMKKAREFALQSSDIIDHPEKGFSVLGADYSEHSASRFRGGLVGWMREQGGLDSWSKAVAAIAFTLEKKGEISEVTTRPEGVFLVRIVDLKPAVTRSFDSVSAELESAERARVRKAVEAAFEQDVAAKHPIEWPEK